MSGQCLFEGFFVPDTAERCCHIPWMSGVLWAFCGMPVKIITVEVSSMFSSWTGMKVLTAVLQMNIGTLVLPVRNASADLLTICKMRCQAAQNHGSEQTESDMMRYPVHCIFSEKRAQIYIKK